MQHRDETEWLLLAQQGDAQAFSELVNLYQRPVFNLCYRMLGNAQEAEDAAQEAFLRAFKSIKRYDTNRKFASWLLSIAANYCIDQHRRKRFTNVDIEGVSPVDLVDGNTSNEQRLIKEEASVEMQELLGILNEKDRAAIVLHYWYDHSYREIAQELGLSENAVKSRLHRARRTLALGKQKQMKKERRPERRQHEAAAA